MSTKYNRFAPAVNEDCTLRRITNWANLTAAEQESTSRAVVHRNKLRLAHCRELQRQGQLQGEGEL